MLKEVKFWLYMKHITNTQRPPLLYTYNLLRTRSKQCARWILDRSKLDAMWILGYLDKWLIPNLYQIHALSKQKYSNKKSLLWAHLFTNRTFLLFFLFMNTFFLVHKITSALHVKHLNGFLFSWTDSTCFLHMSKFKNTITNLAWFSQTQVHPILLLIK